MSVQNNFFGTTTANGGYLVFPACSDLWINRNYPSVTIPLYVKNHPVPVRKYSITETVSVPAVDTSGRSVGAAMSWMGNPDPLQLQISGFFVTPTTPYVFRNNFVFNPTSNGTKTGQSLNLLALSYADVIMAYIEGRMGRGPQGSPVRLHPTEFVDGYGYRYSNPKIMDFSANYTNTTKKTEFNMTLWLEG